MKRQLLMLFVAMMGVAAQAQVKTTKLAVYPEFKPATIKLVDGRILKQPLANVFLKNGALLYVSNGKVMEANMKNINTVDFEDRHYVKIDSLLTYVVGNVGTNLLYRTQVIDVDAYNRNLRNNVNITNLDFGSLIQYTTIDLSTEDDYLLPLIDLYYYQYNGKIIRVHERDIWRVLPKDKRRLFKTIVGKDDFSWTNQESLMELLKYISN